MNKNKKFYLIFNFVLFLIYEVLIFKGFDALGDDSTGGGFIPYGFVIVIHFFIVAVISMIVIPIVWKRMGKTFKLWLAFLIAVLLPILVYNVNLLIFTIGPGADFREKWLIEKSLDNQSPEDKRKSMEDLEKYPIFLTQQDCGAFTACLYIDYELDNPYFFFRKSSDLDVTSGHCRFSVCSEEDCEKWRVKNRNSGEECKVVKISNGIIDEIEFYSDTMVMVLETGERRYAFGEEYFKWFLD